ncbi:hypothetical protein ONZ45_g5522 [Pleurotus djamor]|nr:hypothetical protein ONZ45_g5522 [Pleurotus djamor]
MLDKRFHFIIDPETLHWPPQATEYLHAGEHMSDIELRAKKEMLAAGWGDFMRHKLLMPVPNTRYPTWKTSPCEIDGFIIYLCVSLVNTTFKLVGVAGYSKGVHANPDALDEALVDIPSVNADVLLATL